MSFLPLIHWICFPSGWHPLGLYLQNTARTSLSKVVENTESSKGARTREKILERVNTFYNEHGVDHTLAEMAAHIGLGKSLITNYFPRKEILIITLLRQHQEQLASLAAAHDPGEQSEDFHNFIPYLSDTMELTFRYRGVIAYAMLNPDLDPGIFEHISVNYARNKERIRLRMERFERNGLISPDLLDPDTFEAYFFNYACMSSNWTISHNLLYPGKTLDTVKPLYMKSILCCLKPYLTDKGKEQLETEWIKLPGARASGQRL